MEIGNVKGVPQWLSALPIEDQYFKLYKDPFHGTLSLRYKNIESLTQLPHKCVCSQILSVDHALNCFPEELPPARHNELGKFTLRS